MPEQANPLPPLPKHVHHAVNLSLPVIRIAVFAISVAAAVPTARNLYYSWHDGIPFSQVSHRLAQYDLWVKNLDCKIAYKAISTAAGHKVDVGACQKSGDIAIKITSPLGRSAYEWIAFDQLEKPATQTAELLGLISTAQAVEPQDKPAGHADGQGGGMEVLCQSRQGRQLVQIIRDGGQCFREVVSLIRGSVRRTPSDCNTRC